jgi:hypothetical protein
MNRNIAQNITELLGNIPLVAFRTIGLQTPRVLQRGSFFSINSFSKNWLTNFI